MRIENSTLLLQGKKNVRMVSITNDETRKSTKNHKVYLVVSRTSLKQL